MFQSRCNTSDEASALSDNAPSSRLEIRWVEGQAPLGHDPTDFGYNVQKAALVFVVMP